MRVCAGEREDAGQLREGGGEGGREGARGLCVSVYREEKGKGKRVVKTMQVETDCRGNKEEKTKRRRDKMTHILASIRD
jgi:hypothetical protein